MNHKFISREDGRVLYYGTEGAKAFRSTKEYKKFNYVGKISPEDQEKEEQTAAKKAAKNQKDRQDVENFASEKDLGTKKSAKAKKLTPEEIEALADKVNTKGNYDEEKEEEEEDDTEETLGKDDEQKTAAPEKEKKAAAKKAAKDSPKKSENVTTEQKTAANGSTGAAGETGK